eukprot:1151181-Pelagomonas_calceolata.AAC.7
MAKDDVKQCEGLQRLQPLSELFKASCKHERNTKRWLQGEILWQALKHNEVPECRFEWRPAGSPRQIVGTNVYTVNVWYMQD